VHLTDEVRNGGARGPDRGLVGATASPSPTAAACCPPNAALVRTVNVVNVVPRTRRDKRDGVGVAAEISPLIMLSEHSDMIYPK
jgi:hypothetical protein